VRRRRMSGRPMRTVDVEGGGARFGGHLRFPVMKRPRDLSRSLATFRQGTRGRFGRKCSPYMAATGCAQLAG
jgi:hypothetical protein